ncbi:MAG TPA: DUF2065 domain-containing protein [Patescibacteria group bacterium]|nr:DUF2065 domain-containing protein [Patescibacteria group bacterium]
MNPGTPSSGFISKHDFFTAFALVSAFKGVVYALFPSGMKRMMAEIQSCPDYGAATGGVIRHV